MYLFQEKHEAMEPTRSLDRERDETPDLQKVVEDFKKKIEDCEKKKRELENSEHFLLGEIKRLQQQVKNLRNLLQEQRYSEVKLQ